MTGPVEIAVGAMQNTRNNL